MRRSTRILAILLSLALMLTMAIPVAFADDTTQSADVEAITEESAEATEEVAEDFAQTTEETAAAEVSSDGSVPEEAIEGTADGISVEEISLDEDGIEEAQTDVIKNAGRKILIAGMDNYGHTDLMIILCFTKENEAKIFTVARDTYMKLHPTKKYTIEGKVRDFCKCNRAGIYGSMNDLITELNNHLDLDIKDYIGVSWDCAAALIDSMGGLSVNLTDKDMVNGINELIVAHKKTSKIAAGKQTLNGWQAVEYLRVRKYDDGSARVREDRNRDVFAQLYNQAKGWKVDKRMVVYNAIAGKLKTNISVDGLKALISQFQDVNVVKAPQYPYTGLKKTYWDKWADYNYLVPTTLAKNAIKLHKEVLGESTYKPSKQLNTLSSTIAKHVKKKVIVAKKPKLPSVAKATVTIGAAAYTGKAVTPSVTVKLKKKKLKATYYSVTYKNNVNIGKASIVIEGKCGYGGTKTVTFDIAPAGTSLTGITAGSKSFTATWAQQATKMPTKTIDGYQIQYGLKKNFKKAKTLTVAGYTNTTATVGKLKAKKKYYVRVRTYVGSGKSRVYSNWSAVKTVKPTK